MMQYMLAVHGDFSEDTVSTVSPEDMQRVYKAVDDFNAELQEAGAWVFAGGLHPPTSATTVRFKDGDVLVSDGPFAETKEHLGGFWVIKAADLDAALAWARRGAVACEGSVEVRPFQDEAAD